MNNQFEGQSQVQANAQHLQYYNVQQPQQGYGQQGYTQQTQENNIPQPSSYLGLAIFTTLCCCLPFGIVAIIKGNNVSNLYNMKQYNAAIAASNDAKNWCIYGIVAALIIQAILVVIYLIGGAAALSFLPWSDMLS